MPYAMGSLALHYYFLIFRSRMTGAVFHDLLSTVYHSYCRILPYRQGCACGSCMLVLHILLLTILEHVS